MDVRKAIAGIALLLVAASPRQAAQTPAQSESVIPSLGESIDVTVVNLDLFVTDKKGKRVRGLKADDFEILENRVRQPITNFTEYDTGTPVDVRVEGGVAPATVAAPSQKRTVVLFYELTSLPGFRVKELSPS